MGNVVSLPSLIKPLHDSNHHLSIRELKCLVNAQLDDGGGVNTSFTDSIHRAVHHRNNTIKQLKHYIHTELEHVDSKRSPQWIRNAFDVCNESLKSAISLAVFDRSNVAKLTLYQEMLQNRSIQLPNLEKVFPTNFTRFVYADHLLIRRVQIVTDNLNPNRQFRELIVSEKRLKSLNTEDIQHALPSIDHRASTIEKNVKTSFLEIGIPSDILKSGLSVLDCSMMDESFGLLIDEKLILNGTRPSIICYMYDHDVGFSESVDGVRLDDINDSFSKYFDYHCQYLLVEFFKEFTVDYCDGLDPSLNAEKLAEDHDVEVEEEENSVRLPECSSPTKKDIPHNILNEHEFDAGSSDVIEATEELLHNPSMMDHVDGHQKMTQQTAPRPAPVKKVMIKMDFDSTISASKVFQNCHFNRSNGAYQAEKWHRFDKERLLPVVPLLIVKSHNEEGGGGVASSMLNDGLVIFGRQLLLRIIHHAKSLIELMAAEILSFDLLKQSSRFKDTDVNHRLNMWFTLKSLCVSEELATLIREKCTSTSSSSSSSSEQMDTSSLIVSFNKGYRVFGLMYHEHPIQVTLISNKSSEKMRIATEQFQNNDDLSAIIYEPEDQHQSAGIYLIDMNTSHRRLIDCLDQFDLYALQNMIKHVAEMNCSLKEQRGSFRPDNIYVDDEGSISINRNIPNDPRLPFILKNGVKVKPFHIHPRINQICPYFDQAQEKVLVEFIYSYGWLVWVVIEGTGERSVNSADNDAELWFDQIEKFGRFRKCPDYLKEVMRMCWSISANNDLEKFDIHLQKRWEKILLNITNCTWI